MASALRRQLTESADAAAADAQRRAARAAARAEELCSAIPPRKASRRELRAEALAAATAAAAAAAQSDELQTSVGQRTGTLEGTALAYALAMQLRQSGTFDEVGWLPGGWHVAHFVHGTPTLPLRMLSAGTPPPTMSARPWQRGLRNDQLADCDAPCCSTQGIIHDVHALSCPPLSLCKCHLSALQGEPAKAWGGVDHAPPSGRDTALGSAVAPVPLGVAEPMPSVPSVAQQAAVVAPSA